MEFRRHPTVNKKGRLYPQAMKTAHILAPLLLVSCVNLSGKLDRVGRQVAVFDPDKTVSTRYEEGGKRYIPVTVRRCEAAPEDWLILPRPSGIAKLQRGTPEPQGTEESYAVEEGSEHPALLTEEELSQRQLKIVPAKSIKQGTVFAAMRTHPYWSDAHGEKRLLYAESIPDRRSVGNQLRRPLVWGLSVVDGTLSVSMWAGEVILAPVVVPILVAVSDTRPAQTQRSPEAAATTER